MKIKLKYINNKRAFCHCPYHEDKNASLEICLTGEHYGKYYCFSCGRAGTMTKGMMEILESQKVDKKSNNTRTISIDWDKLNDQYKKNIYWIGSGLLGLEWKVDQEVLDDLNMGWDGEAYTFPMRNEYNEIIGIQRRFPDGFKCAVEDSRNGLFIPIPLDIGSYSACFICEGASDLATLLELGYFGIARPNYNSCNDMVDAWLRINLDEDNPVYIIADNDQPGVKGTEDLAKQIGIPLSHVVVPQEKDLRKEVEVHGKEKTNRFINFYLG